MVGVFMVMWLAALMALAASGMHHRELASRFIAHTSDRAAAFSAADNALAAARDVLTRDERAADIAAAGSVFDAGPYGVIEANHRGNVWYQKQVPRWRTVDWQGSGAVIAGRSARYFIERIAFSAYLTDEPAVRDASVRRYRVSAMGCGDLPGTRVYLQAIYEVRRQTQDARSRGPSSSFSSRLLNWREVVAWRDGANNMPAQDAHRERCDAS